MAQFRLNETEFCSLSLITSPYNTFNLGIEFEFDSVIYVRPTVFISNQENEYTKVFAAIGMPFEIGTNERTLVYAGARLGIIKRDRANGFAGAEIGINYRISDSIIIGIRETIDHNSDYTFFPNEKSSELKTVIKIGFKL